MPKYVEVEVPNDFVDDEDLSLTLFDALEGGATVGTAQAVSRDALIALLAEALNHITDKPWDDRTHLHGRICDALGRPRAYPGHYGDIDD